MKNRILIRALAALIVFGFTLVRAGNYSLTWYKISGGGGTSTNGNYSITGTLGQPDASGAISGGNYSVTGGFWSLISVVQTSGSPTLTLSRNGSTVTVSWPSSSTGFALLQTSDLTTGNWTTSSYTITNDGTNKSVRISAANGNLFLRLKSQ